MCKSESESSTPASSARSVVVAILLVRPDKSLAQQWTASGHLRRTINRSTRSVRQRLGLLGGLDNGAGRGGAREGRQTTDDPYKLVDSVRLYLRDRRYH